MNNTNLQWDVPEKICRALPAGVFMTTKEEKVNTMIIGWGQYGVMWAKKVFMAPVRQTRFTHQQIPLGGSFTVSVPAEGMKAAVGFCGKESGKHHEDKLAACGLATVPARVVDTPVIAGCPLHLECVIRGTFDMDLGQLSAAERTQWYAGTEEYEGNFHTLVFGEIVAAYEEK